MVNVAPAMVGGTYAMKARFVENGAGTYNAVFSIPAEATLLDIIVEAEALWAAGTSAALIVGDAADPDGWFASTNLKATALLAGESISLGSTQVQGGVVGAYAIGTLTHMQRGAGKAGATITATVTSVGAGTTGRTLVTVLYASGAPTVITQ